MFNHMTISLPVTSSSHRHPQSRNCNKRLDDFSPVLPYIGNGKYTSFGIKTPFAFRHISALPDAVATKMIMSWTQRGRQLHRENMDCQERACKRAHTDTLSAIERLITNRFIILNAKIRDFWSYIKLLLTCWPGSPRDRRNSSPGHRSFLSSFRVMIK